MDVAFDKSVQFEHLNDPREEKIQNTSFDKPNW